MPVRTSVLLIGWCALAVPALADGVVALEAERIDFGCTVVQVVAAADGSRLFAIGRNDLDAPSRLLVWDVAAWKLDKELELPAPPTSMAWCEGKLVVACPTSRPGSPKVIPGGAIAIVDPATLAVDKVEGRVGKRTATPLSVLRYSPKGKAVVLVTRPGEGKDEADSTLVELDLKSRALTPLGLPALYAVFLDDRILAQRFGGNPSGSTTVYSLAECRKRPVKWASAPAPEWHDDHSPLRVVNGGKAVVSTVRWYETASFDPKTLAKGWSTCGQIIDVIEPKSVLVLAEYLHPATGVVEGVLHMSGVDAGAARTTWRATLALPEPFRYGPFRWGPPPTAILSGPERDDLLIGFGDIEHIASARRVTWYRVRLPAPAAEPVALAQLDKAPPTTMVWGDELDLRLVKDPKDTATYVLQAGPPGMAFDAATGKLTWMAAKVDYGKTDIVIGVEAGGVVISVIHALIYVSEKKR